MPYSTKQQQAVLRCLEARQSEALSAQELAEALRREGFSVGLATVYRQLERLEEAGVVHKVNTESGAFYLYCSHGEGRRDCFLLKCEKCGCIRHLDCSHLQILYDHLEQDHHFRINPRRTLFLGLCEECAGKEAEEHGTHQ